MRIVLGVTGSISAYKSVDVMRIFQKGGHAVTVILTPSACNLISPMIFDTFSPGNVHTSMFRDYSDPLLHINLCKDNDLLLVAPATANIIGKFANGIADDLLSTTFIAWHKKVVLSPAMNVHMLHNPAVMANLDRLRERGIRVLDPGTGELACNEEGEGRLPSALDIFTFCMGE
jgi:phosphopantothenoylcysteine decarboxylase/phosphopantothenate--cysteine ligase